MHTYYACNYVYWIIIGQQKNDAELSQSGSKPEKRGKGITYHTRIAFNTKNK